MKIKNLLMAIILVAFTTASYSQNCGILDQVVKASGGKEKFDGVKSSYLEMKNTMYQGGQTMAIDMKIWTKDNSKFYAEQTVMGMNIKMAIEGDKGWMVNPMAGGVQDIPKEQFNMIKDQLKQSSNFDFFSNWKNLGYVCEELGIVDVDDKKCNKVKVTDDKKDVSTFYIDAITNLIYKIESKTEGTDVYVIIKQYGKKDGLYYPKFMETYASGSLLSKMEITNISYNIPIDDAKFKKP